MRWLVPLSPDAAKKPFEPKNFKLCKITCLILCSRNPETKHSKQKQYDDANLIL
jgi:hypothetical protein